MTLEALDSRLRDLEEELKQLKAKEEELKEQRKMLTEQEMMGIEQDHINKKPQEPLKEVHPTPEHLAFQKQSMKSPGMGFLLFYTLIVTWPTNNSYVFVHVRQ